MECFSEYIPLPEGKRQYPFEYMEANHVIKLSETEKTVLIGIAEDDERLKDDLKNFHDKDVEFISIDHSELSSFLARRFSSSIDTVDIADSYFTEKSHALDKLANDAPVVNLVNSIIIDAIAKGVSDIHIESFSKRCSVRYRMDGLLVHNRTVAGELFSAVSSRIKIMANMNIMERRLPQDGRISVNMHGHDVDLRVSVVPITAGESIVLRLLNKRSEPLSLQELGFSHKAEQVMKELYTKTNGLLLLTGPTGSGKTTTLNSIIRELNDPSVKIITIEDPVEYEIDGIDQIQTNEKIGLTFDSILRRVLRQDPNIIMVGEIRDKKTAELAVRASMTGHLVLSTVHTNDSVSVLHRMINMGIEPYLLAGVLRGAMAQRLVRRLCHHCKDSFEPDSMQIRLFADHGVKAERLYEKQGCDQCGHTGYSGRLVISEVFQSSEVLEDMISKSVPSTEIQNYLLKQGMRTLYYDGLIKAAAGLTTLDEVEKAVLI